MADVSCASPRVRGARLARAPRPRTSSSVPFTTNDPMLPPRMPFSSATSTTLTTPGPSSAGAVACAASAARGGRGARTAPGTTAMRKSLKIPSSLNSCGAARRVRVGLAVLCWYRPSPVTARLRRHRAPAGFGTFRGAACVRRKGESARCRDAPTAGLRTCFAEANTNSLCGWAHQPRGAERDAGRAARRARTLSASARLRLA